MAKRNTVKQFLRDPETWFILFYNGVLLFLFLSKKMDPRLVIWAYFLQSIFVGAQYLAFKTIAVSREKGGFLPLSNHRPQFFFLGHFGLFHFVYLIFIWVLSFRTKAEGSSLFDVFTYVKWSALALFLNWLIQFIRELMVDTPTHANLSVVVPYARILPMHIIIILSMFFALDNVWVFGLFILLKLIGDLALALVFNTED